MVLPPLLLARRSRNRWANDRASDRPLQRFEFRQVPTVSALRSALELQVAMNVLVGGDHEEAVRHRLCRHRPAGCRARRRAHGQYRASAALDYEGVKCEETGMTKDGLNFHVHLHDGQIYGVFFTAEGVAGSRPSLQQGQQVLRPRSDGSRPTQQPGRRGARLGKAVPLEGELAGRLAELLCL